MPLLISGAITGEECRMSNVRLCLLFVLGKIDYLQTCKLIKFLFLEVFLHMLLYKMLAGVIKSSINF